MSTTFDTTEVAPRTTRIPASLRALPRRTLIVLGMAVVAAFAGIGWIAMPASSVSTDDAYIEADSTVIAPEVKGLISAILVRNNQRVKTGQPLIQIDPEDYGQDVRAAEAEVQSAATALDQQAAQQKLAAANVAAAKAAIRAADAERVRTSADHRRFDKLVKNGDVSRSQADQARAAAIAASAESDKARAALAAAEQQLNVVIQSRAQLRAELSKADADLALARQHLNHTTIRSPIDGVVGARQAQLGEYVQPGTQLMTLVPLRAIYVTANFKETQTARMLAGQKVTMTFDALPGDTFTGTVQSFAPGSGSQFALLPFEPATGNFTRIVQRIPVRIHFDPGQVDEGRLRSGLSANVVVDLTRRAQ